MQQMMPEMMGTEVRLMISMGLLPVIEAMTMITAATGDMERIRLAVSCIGRATATLLTPTFSVISGMMLIKE